MPFELLARWNLQPVPILAGTLSFVTLSYKGITQRIFNDFDAGHGPGLTGLWRRLLAGGPVIAVWKLARAIGCFALLALSVLSVASDQLGEQALASLQDPSASNRSAQPTLHLEGVQKRALKASYVVLYTYVSLLSLAVVPACALAARHLQLHLDMLLFIFWSTYAVRDLFPLATFTLVPLDIADTLLWPKICLLSFVGVIVPLCIPHIYLPLDPLNPSAHPPPEQTVSWLSFFTFSFLDPLIWKGFRSTHLGYDQLPALADYDDAEYLRARAFPDLDPFDPLNGAFRQRHLFFQLLHVFRTEYIWLSLGMSMRVLTEFVAPIGLNRLLNYLESGGEGAIVRPWVWVCWLFLGPWLGSISFEVYIFLATRTLVRAEAMITQLVFEHALRLRMHDNGPQASSNTLKNAGLNGKTPEPSTAPRKGANLTGRLNNLVTADLNNITDARDFLFIVLYCPLQLVVCMWFLYEVLGVASFAGLTTMLIAFPIPRWVATQIGRIAKERARKTDARVQEATETMGLLRMIKMFAWEPKVLERLSSKREDELEWIRKGRVMALVNLLFIMAIPLLAMIVTYSTYTVVLGRELTASRIFSSMVVFEMLRDQFRAAGFNVPTVIQAKVSLDRLSAFLRSTELLDKYVEKLSGAPPVSVPGTAHDPSCVGFRDASFKWTLFQDQSSSDAFAPDPAASSLRRDFTLRVPGSLLFTRGALNLVIGPTGCGKTSLLLALCGELHFMPLASGAWYNISRTDGIAYAAQEGWVQNETIRDNILFGAPFDEVRYRKVLHQCGLERDLALFVAGDMTEVGEKGVTLSGGQKARITLARAVYSKAEVLLLDDVLAALDVHTSRWVVDKCFQGDLVQGRTVILVTHNIPLVADIAAFVVALSNNGQVVMHGPPAEVLSSARDELVAVVEEAVQAEEQAEKEQQSVDDPASSAKNDAGKDHSGKLIVAEEIATGHVGWPALRLYFRSLGGFAFWTFYLGGVAASNALVVLQMWFLGYWAERYDYEKHVHAAKYVSVYASLVILGLSIYTMSYMAFVYGSMRASRKIHDHLISSILGTTLRWLDTVPVSRVIMRCTQDLRSVDGPLGKVFGEIVETSFSILARLAPIVILSPVFVLPALLVAVVGWTFGQLYIRSQLSVKREMSNARSPVLSHFGAAMAGLTSIRIYGAEAAFKREIIQRINKYSRAARSYYNLNRWMGIRINAIGGLFSGALATYLLYGPSLGASSTGFLLTLTVGFSRMILWWTRNVNSFEVEGNSIWQAARLLAIKRALRVEHLEARYSLDGPLVLKGINFELKSGERVGVVGRTGSGKSSLMLALLRCIFTTGHVYYDGLATDTLNLNALRGNITIIPQQPELLSGSLRQNLDPFGEHDDATLNAALRAAGLSSLQALFEEGGIALDTPISSGGGNLSFGQRQIVALARAITRRSKILILDEATAAIDHATDTAIQDSLRNELKNVTLITVAHRLRTVIDADKIMVLDAGRLVEFNSPRALLKNKAGHFRALVDGSSDRDALIAMAHVT